jgi:hypothetical protein
LSDPEITLELKWKNIVFRIRTHKDIVSLEKGLDDVIAFVNHQNKKLLKFSDIETSANIQTKKTGTEEENVALKFRLPAWFYDTNPTLLTAIGLILYDMNEPVSSRTITEIITKGWRKVELKNISKQLTSRGRTLYSYIRKDAKTKGYYFTAEGKKWFETTIIPDTNAK